MYRLKNFNLPDLEILLFKSIIVLGVLGCLYFFLCIAIGIIASLLGTMSFELWCLTNNLGWISAAVMLVTLILLIIAVAINHVSAEE